MKIAINCAFYQPRGGGIAEYIYNLVSNIALLDEFDEYILYVLKDMEEYAKQNLPDKYKIKIIPYKSSPLGKIMRSLFEQRFWIREEALERFDLFHSPFFHSPRFKHARILITVHDLRFFRFPQTYSFPRYVYLKCVVKKSCLTADHIITISQFTKEELMAAYHLQEDKITVVHEAINRKRFSSTFASSFVLPEQYNSLKTSPYILTVGHLEPRKNYMRLINAFEIMRENQGLKGYKLVIVGKKGHHYKEVLKKVEKDPDIFYLDFVNHDFLQWLYGNAQLFAFPSFYEGFGFPPLEAGCYGVVSAVSNVSSMPEVCGDAVFYFNPYDVANMAQILSSALTDMSQRSMKRKLMAHQLECFSWSNNVKQTIEIYKRVYGKNKA